MLLVLAGTLEEKMKNYPGTVSSIPQPSLMDMLKQAHEQLRSRIR